MSVKAKKVIYLGDDEAYFKAITGEYLKLYPTLGIRMVKITEAEKSKIQSLYHKTFKENPALILIDFSKNSDEYFHLARLFVRTNQIEPCPIIGLHDYLSPPNIIKEGFLSGVKVNFIKSAELFDLVYASVNLIDPSQVKEHGFANAQLTDTLEVALLAKIGFINTTSIHLESDFVFDKGADVNVRHFWIDKKIVPSKKFKVANNESSILFYPFKQSMDLDFLYVDPPVFSETDTPERTQELKDKYEHDLNKSKKKLKEWIKDNDSVSLKKKVRILAVEKELSFYSNTGRIDQFDHSIRCQPYIQDVKNEIGHFKPQLIVFSIEGEKIDPNEKPENIKKVEGQKDIPINDFDQLKDFMKKIKEQFKEGYNPYVVLFNTDRVSADVQKTLGNNQVVCYPGKMSIEMILKMAKAFEAKINDEIVGIRGKDPFTVFIKKNAAHSIAEIEDKVTLKELSETDMIFTSSKNFPPFTPFIVTHPFKAYITVFQHAQKSKPGEYFALINGVGEIDKKLIRKYVNSVFFRDHDAQVKTEKDEFFNLNKQKMEEIAAEEKKKAEEALLNESNPTDSDDKAKEKS
jgi:hypothetical protein